MSQWLKPSAGTLWVNLDRFDTIVEREDGALELTRQQGKQEEPILVEGEYAEALRQALQERGIAPSPPTDPNLGYIAMGSARRSEG